jgi:hypothetical protein
MKKRHFFLAIALAFISAIMFAQEEFKPSGSPFAKIYFNYHADLSGNGTGFEIQRAYFGYKYSISETFSGHITLDVGSPEVDINDSVTVGTSFEMTAFLKTAAVAYSQGNLKVEAGLIGLQQFKLQESYWKRRYIYKSFQDWTKMGPSADLGAMVSYRFFDILSADLTVRNGEGYKKLQSDKALNTGLGITLTPFKGLVIRGFYDYIDISGPQYTISSFIGYKNDIISVGAEHNIQLNYGNVSDRNLKGFSIYASVNLTKKIELFGRFDNLGSNQLEGETENWNMSKDGNLIITGIEYSPIKNVQLALDYQGFLYADADKDSKNLVYLNFQYAF